MVTFACLRKRRKPSSSGRRMRSACPLPLIPRAVLPTLWMYSCGQTEKLKLTFSIHQNLKELLTNTIYNNQSHKEPNNQYSVPWGHLGGHTGQSSPPQGYPDLELPRQCTAGCQNRRCRTGRRWWYVWSASACPG